MLITARDQEKNKVTKQLAGPRLSAKRQTLGYVRRYSKVAKREVFRPNVDILKA